jgi:Flp pilus assembly protein TadD
VAARRSPRRPGGPPAPGRRRPAARLARAADAVADFDDLLRRNPDDHWARHQRARALARLGRDREAVADLDRLIPLYPRSADMLRLRGRSQARLGDPARAVADFRKVVELAPDDAQAANNLAWRLVTGPEALRNPAEAVALAERAVRLAPQQWTYHNTLGVVYYRLGRYAEAVKSLTTSLEHTADQSGAYDLYVLAMCHSRLGDPAQARDCFERAVRWQQRAKLQPADIEDLNELRAEAAALLGMAVGA